MRGNSKESFSHERYEQKVEAIFGRHPSVQKVPFKDAYKPGLGNMLVFSELLGNPHLSLRTVHVAGTNGKGSVSTMLASVLAASGLRAGLYTSPHIEDFRERARIISPAAAAADSKEVKSGSLVELVSEEYVYDFLTEYEDAIESLGLSFFEITTGLAFKWLADSKVDVAVIETGLGGRLDSTNIIVPDLSIVTNIALDHTALLGPTLQAIAGEKAGIFKSGVPALVGEFLEETRPVFEAKARETGSQLIFAQDEEPPLWSKAADILKVMDLRGAYQRKNLRTVLAAVDILKRLPAYSSLSGEGGEAAVIEGIVHAASRTGFHGRWERISDNPLIITDIGHNPAALKENFSQLENMLQAGEISDLIIVYAVMADKDLDGIMPLMPKDAAFIFTSPQISRALSADELYSRVQAYRIKNGLPLGQIFEEKTPDLALAKACELAKKSDKPLIFIGGSTYLTSEITALMKD